MLSDQELDKILTEIIQSEINGLEVPAGSRERVRKALGLQRKSSRLLRFSRLAGVAALLLAFIVLSSYLFFPAEVKAIGCHSFSKTLFGTFHTPTPGIRQKIR